MSRFFTRRFREGLATTLLFLLALVAAILFIMPTVLTITNSFMTEKEITANYGAMIDNATQDKKTYIAEDLNLKFIPDRVSLQQFATVLFKSPDYLLKFWNSVILVVPITVFQILLAAVTAYGFYTGPQKALPGNELSPAQTVSLIAWLTEQYGFDQVSAFCFGQKNFQEAFGIGYAEAVDLWSAWLNSLCG